MHDGGVAPRDPYPKPGASSPERHWADRRLHLIGMGGAGMSAYALAAHALGAQVTGSDRAWSPYAESMRARIRPLLRRMIQRAQEQGALRPDFTPEDLPLVFWTADRVIDRTAAVAPDYWRRFLGLLLDGLQADAASPLPRPPLTRAQLERTA